VGADASGKYDATIYEKMTVPKQSKRGNDER
jgi:hypothetical protein